MNKEHKRRNFPYYIIYNIANILIDILIVSILINLDVNIISA